MESHFLYLRPLKHEIVWYQCHHLGFDFGPKQYQTVVEDVDISGIIEENGKVWPPFLDDIYESITCMYVPASSIRALLITQMEVTFSPLKRSRIKSPSSGHWEEPGIGPSF